MRSEGFINECLEEAGKISGLESRIVRTADTQMHRCFMLKVRESLWWFESESERGRKGASLLGAPKSFRNAHGTFSTFFDAHQKLDLTTSQNTSPPVGKLFEGLQEPREPEQCLQPLRLERLLGENRPHVQGGVVCRGRKGRIYTAPRLEEPPHGGLDGDPKKEQGGHVGLRDCGIECQMMTSAEGDNVREKHLRIYNRYCRRESGCPGKRDQGR